MKTSEHNTSTIRGIIAAISTHCTLDSLLALEQQRKSEIKSITDERRKSIGESYRSAESMMHEAAYIGKLEHELAAVNFIETRCRFAIESQRTRTFEGDSATSLVEQVITAATDEIFDDLYHSEHAVQQAVAMRYHLGDLARHLLKTAADLREALEQKSKELGVPTTLERKRPAKSAGSHLQWQLYATANELNLWTAVTYCGGKTQRHWHINEQNGSLHINSRHSIAELRANAYELPHNTPRTWNRNASCTL